MVAPQNRNGHSCNSPLEGTSNSRIWLRILTLCSWTRKVHRACSRSASSIPWCPEHLSLAFSYDGILRERFVLLLREAWIHSLCAGTHLPACLPQERFDRIHVALELSRRSAPRSRLCEHTHWES